MASLCSYSFFKILPSLLQTLHLNQRYESWTHPGVLYLIKNFYFKIETINFRDFPINIQTLYQSRYSTQINLIYLMKVQSTMYLISLSLADIACYSPKKKSNFDSKGICFLKMSSCISYSLDAFI